MKRTRGMKQIGRSSVALAILFGSVLVATTSSGAQDDTGTLRVRVVYPNGSLATDATICLNGFFAGGGFAFGASGLDVGADSVTQLPAGEYFVRNICAGSANLEIASIWNTGDAPGYVDGISNFQTPPVTPSKLLGHVPATVRPGETTVVTLTTGKSIIRGTISGDSPTNRACTVEAVGKPIGSFAESAPHGIVTFDGPNYELFVPPGDYRISTVCLNLRAPRYWPNNTPFIDNAQTITVAHGQTISGIDFTPATYSGPLAGGFIFIDYRVSESSTNVLYCVDAERADLGGATVQRIVAAARDTTGALLRVPRGGAYKLRFWDCLGQGFDDVWYPNSSTYEGGETIPAVPEDGVAFLSTPVAIIPDPAHLCGGRRATILGTDEADDIVGTEGNDVIVGLGGNDLIRGMGGNDIICGGPGRDRIFGGHGRDLLFGGNQNDILRGEGGKDVLHGGRGNDMIIGGGRDDTLFGGPGRDKLFGGQGRDRLLGGNKNDFLRGDGGRDFLDGGRGNDILIGGGGNDGLFGGPGPIDRLFGKAGFDLCVDATIIRECEIGVDP